MCIVKVMVDEKIDAGISKAPGGSGGSSVGFVILRPLSVSD
jgi:hypothetical protein